MSFIAKWDVFKAVDIEVQVFGVHPEDGDCRVLRIFGILPQRYTLHATRLDLKVVCSLSYRPTVQCCGCLDCLWVRSQLLWPMSDYSVTSLVASASLLTVRVLVFISASHIFDYHISFASKNRSSVILFPYSFSRFLFILIRVVSSPL
jgi:hypothetical protein